MQGIFFMFTKDSGHRHSLLWQWLTAVVVLSTILITYVQLGRPMRAIAALSWTGGSTAGSGTAAWYPFSGDVNASNGHLMIMAGGLHIPGVNGLAELVIPTYNSLDAANSTDMGNGWTMGTGR